MRIVCISDTHNQLARVEVPDGDLLIHAGDLTRMGTASELFMEVALLAKMPHERIIFTPGNHDWGFETDTNLRKALASTFPRVTVLIDEEILIDGLRLYASPYQPFFNDWAFQFAPGLIGSKEAVKKWDLIPNRVNVLVTHGPPFGILDKTLNSQNVGCKALEARLEHLADLRLHVFGHVHESYGQRLVGSVLHVNASTCDALYRAIQPPVVIDLGP